MNVTAVWNQEEDWFGISENTMSAFVKKALLAAVTYRHLKYVPLHFTMAAYMRYPTTYKRRVGRKTRRWEQRELGLGSHDNLAPLYETGETETDVRTLAQFTASKQRGTRVITARARFPVPDHLKYIKQWGYDPSAELAATNRQEIGKMLEIFRTHLQQSILIKKPRRRRVQV